MNQYLKVFARGMFLVLSVFVLCPSAFPINDFWLGSSYSVRVAFAVQDAPHVNPPAFKTLSMPSYPIELFRAGVAGKVTVQFVVGEDGGVSGLSFLHADDKGFAQEVKATVEKWSFSPGKNRESGQPVAVQMQAQFEFGNDDDAEPIRKNGWSGSLLDKPTGKVNLQAKPKHGEDQRAKN